MGVEICNKNREIMTFISGGFYVFEIIVLGRCTLCYKLILQRAEKLVSACNTQGCFSDSVSFSSSCDLHLLRWPQLTSNSISILVIVWDPKAPRVYPMGI